MAVKRTKSVSEMWTGESRPVEAGESRKTLRSGGKWWIWVIVILLGLGLYWYKTNSWPILAMVGFRPITRYEINQSLFNRAGKAELENKITELQVAEELKKLGIKVTDQEVDAKIDEIKAGLGEGANFDEMLTSYGMTLADLKQQMKLKVGAEKAVSDKLTVTDEEAAQYLTNYGGSATDAAKLATAKEMVRQNKVVSEVQAWVEAIQAKYKVWKVPGM